MLKYLNKYSYFDLSFLFNISLSLLFLFFTRILIYFLNKDLFIIENYSELTEIMLHGLRFDIATLFMINALYIIFKLQPYNINHKMQNIVGNIIFIVPNIVAFATNLVDIIYIRFTLRRTTAEVFDFLKSIHNEMGALFFTFIKDYFLIFIHGLLILIAFVMISIYIGRHTKTLKIKVKYKLLLLLGFIILSIIAIRGGLQLRPINMITAAQYATNNQNIPIVTNTPFTIIKTFNKNDLHKFNFFEEQQLEKIFNPIKPTNNKQLQKHNFVIIILESFSNKYTNILKNKQNSCTPFLDSLAQHSLYFQNMYANGKKSIEALPAIILGIPSLSNIPFGQSVFATNNTEGIISILKDLGYNSAFYHGGNNGTMGFDDFVKYGAFDKYYGRNEYNNDLDFDGKWGIFDHKFYQYYAEHFNKNKTPFIDVIFSLSSHHPYTIHPDFEHKIPKNKTKVERAIIYADLSLKHLFNNIKQNGHFQNTIFIITADHTSEEIKDPNEAYSIPLIIYSHKQTYKGISYQITQQIDIKPLILNMINYNKHYYSLGNNPLDSNSDAFAVYYSNENYNFIFQNRHYLFNNETIKTTKNKQDKNINIIKAFLQTYSNDLIKNRMNTIRFTSRQRK